MSQHTQVHVPENARAALKKAASAAPAVSVAGRLGLGLVGVVQVAFAFLAFWDLAQRPASDVKGPKPVWIPVILVNWIGPAAYFLFGIKR
jgi:hypothetical protein